MSGLESVNGTDLSLQQFEQPSAPTRTPAAPVSMRDTAAGPSLPESRLSEALAAFDAEETLPPVPDSMETIAAILRNALLLIDNREHHLATNLLRNVLMRRPNEPRALRWLGHCLREEGRLEEAMKCFKALVATTGDDEGRSLYAETLYLMGRDAAAMEVYNELLGRLTESSPALFDIYKNLGNIHVRAGDFDSAEECYNRANTLRCDSDILMVNYGTLEVQRENFSLAVERFRRAVELNPSNDKGWVGLAMVHRQMGDLELGRANLQRALDINPRNKTALHLLAEWNLQDGDFTSSVARLADYLALEGEDCEMSFLLARILIHMNRLNEAMLEMERVLALDPATQGAMQVMSSLQAEIRRRSEPA